MDMYDLEAGYFENEEDNLALTEKDRLFDAKAEEDERTGYGSDRSLFDSDYEESDFRKAFIADEISRTLKNMGIKSPDNSKSKSRSFGIEM